MIEEVSRGRRAAGCAQPGQEGLVGSPADIQQCFAFLFLIFAERSGKRFG